MMGGCIARQAQSIGSSKPVPQEAEVSIAGLSGSRIPAMEEVWEQQKCLHLMLCALAGMLSRRPRSTVSLGEMPCMFSAKRSGAALGVSRACFREPLWDFAASCDPVHAQSFQPELGCG